MENRQTTVVVAYSALLTFFGLALCHILGGLAPPRVIWESPHLTEASITLQTAFTVGAAHEGVHREVSRRLKMQNVSGARGGNTISAVLVEDAEDTGLTRASLFFDRRIQNGILELGVSNTFGCWSTIAQVQPSAPNVLGGCYTQKVSCDDAVEVEGGCLTLTTVSDRMQPA